jgi:hypothetical protein
MPSDRDRNTPARQGTANAIFSRDQSNYHLLALMKAQQGAVSASANPLVPAQSARQQAAPRPDAATPGSGSVKGT